MQWMIQWLLYRHCRHVCLMLCHCWLAYSLKQTCNVSASPPQWISLSVWRHYCIRWCLLWLIFATDSHMGPRIVRIGPFLANVNSRSRSLYAIARPSVVCLSSVCRLSVCRLSVTFVRPTQAVQIFGNISTALGILATHWHPPKILRRSSQGNPSAGGVEHKRGSKI